MGKHQIQRNKELVRHCPPPGQAGFVTHSLEQGLSFGRTIEANTWNLGFALPKPSPQHISAKIVQAHNHTHYLFPRSHPEAGPAQTYLQHHRLLFFLIDGNVRAMYPGIGAQVAEPDVGVSVGEIKEEGHMQTHNHSIMVLSVQERTPLNCFQLPTPENLNSTPNPQSFG